MRHFSVPSSVQSFSLTGRRQRGVGLLEALAALLVLCMGVLTVAGLQTHLRLGADLSRQRSEAVRLAQADLEGLRAATHRPASNVARFDVGPTAYTVSRVVAAWGALAAQHVVVKVDWADRNGSAQQVSLNTLISAQEPLYSGALSLLSVGGKALKGAFGRVAGVPWAAKDLGDGRSVLKFTEAGTKAVLFNNATGQVSGRCSGLSAHQATHQLTAQDLGSCQAVAALWLSGTVRFSQSIPPNPARAHDPPRPLSMAVNLSGGSYAQPAECAHEVVTSPHHADRYVAYRCLVHPLGNGQWSGRVAVVPSGWALGSGPNDGRVCRYTADLDGSGAIDANAEHPSEYRAVKDTLANQNFLVVAGSQACPAGLDD
jgi:Tfp pilus assembly protein PilV